MRKLVYSSFWILFISICSINNNNAQSFAKTKNYGELPQNSTNKGVIITNYLKQQVKSAIKKIEVYAPYDEFDSHEVARTKYLNAERRVNSENKNYSLAGIPFNLCCYEVGRQLFRLNWLKFQPGIKVSCYKKQMCIPLKLDIKMPPEEARNLKSRAEGSSLNLEYDVVVTNGKAEIKISCMYLSKNSNVIYRYDLCN